jgi:hypothetical protein
LIQPAIRDADSWLPLGTFLTGAMSLFSKKDADHHAGSGLDKPDPESLLEKLTDALKPAPSVTPTDTPAAPKEEVVSPLRSRWVRLTQRKR